LLKLERAGEGFGGRELRKGMAAAVAAAVAATAEVVAAAVEETTVTLSSWRRTKEATTGQQSHFLTYVNYIYSQGADPSPLLYTLRQQVISFERGNYPPASPLRDIAKPYQI
jgi:hypothetical protein